MDLSSFLKTVSKCYRFLKSIPTSIEDYVMLLINMTKNRFKCKFETSNNFVKSCEQVGIEINKTKFITKISFTADYTLSPFDSLLRIHNKIVTLLDS